MNQFIICVYVTSDAPWLLQLGADSGGEMDSGPWGNSESLSKTERELKKLEIQKVFKFRPFLLVTKGFQTRVQ